MDYSKRRCGECNQKGFKEVKIHGLWQRPWRDFPVVFITNDILLWQCEHCGSQASNGVSTTEVDFLIEKA
jgi:ribosomal protein L37AE/L43A